MAAIPPSPMHYRSGMGRLTLAATAGPRRAIKPKSGATRSMTYQPEKTCGFTASDHLALWSLTTGHSRKQLSASSWLYARGRRYVSPSFSCSVGAVRLSPHFESNEARTHMNAANLLHDTLSLSHKICLWLNILFHLVQAMRISSIFCVVGWLSIYISKGAWSLDIGRLSLGFGIGILSFVVPTYIAEITPKNMRGALTTANQLLIVCGGSFSYLLGTVVTWRTLALMGFLPSMLQMFGLCFIPESPRWLAKVGKQENFESELRRLRGGSADISDEAIEIQKYVENIAKLPKARIRDLFRRNYLYSVIIAVGLILLQQFGGINGIGFYASETFVAAGFSSGNAGTVAMAAIQVPVTTVGALLLDRVGRRPLIMVSATGTCLGCFLAGLSFLIKGHVSSPDIIPILALAGILLYIGSFSIGLGAVPWLIMSEIFPLHVKGMAGSLVTLVHWFGSWAISYAFNFLMTWSSSGTLFVFSAVGALTVLFVAKLVPETKGRTLEEITSAMSSFPSTKL